MTRDGHEVIRETDESIMTAWRPHVFGRDHDLDEIVRRRFGRDHAAPCKRPDVLTCALSQCQHANECRYGDRA